MPGLKYVFFKQEESILHLWNVPYVHEWHVYKSICAHFTPKITPYVNLICWQIARCNRYMTRGNWHFGLTQVYGFTFSHIYTCLHKDSVIKYCLLSMLLPLVQQNVLKLVWLNYKEVLLCVSVIVKLQNNGF